MFPTVSAGFQPERERFSGAALASRAAATVQPDHRVSSTSPTRRMCSAARAGRSNRLQAQADYQRFELEATYLHADLQRRRGRGQGGIVARPDRRDPGHHQGGADQLGVVRQQFDLGALAQADVLTQQATLAQTARHPAAAAEAAGADSATSLPRLPAASRARSRRDLRSRQPAAAAAICRSACPRSWSSSGRTFARRRRSSMRRAPMSASPSPISCRNSRITGSLRHRSALAVSNLFSPGTGIWSIAGGITQTMFDGGTLLHKKRAAVAAFDAGGGAISQHGDHGVPERRRRAAGAAIRRRCAAWPRPRRSRSAFDSLRSRAAAISGSARITYLDAARTPSAPGSRRASPGPGRGRPVRRYGRAVPGARRRLVAPRRTWRRCRTARLDAGDCRCRA